MIQVFISYAREDVAFARKLVNDLNVYEGIEPWFDEVSLLPGMNWEKEIIQAINKSSFVVLLLSKNSINKEGFVQKEIREVLERMQYMPPGKIFAVPARVEECKPEHPYLTELHWVDLYTNWHSGIQLILKSFGLENLNHKINSSREGDELSIIYNDLINTIEEGVQVSYAEELRAKAMLAESFLL